VNRCCVVAVLAAAALGATTGVAVAQTVPNLIDVRGGGDGIIDTSIVGGGAAGASKGGTKLVGSGSGGGGSGGDSDAPVCEFVRLPTSDDPGPPPRKAYVRTCTSSEVNGTLPQIVMLLDAGVLPPQVTPDQLAQRALNQLQLPDPQVDLSPNPDIVAYQLVNLPTWWAVENWAPQTQRTQVGPVFAEVTATPVSTRFDGGDGSAPVTCNRRGVKWRSGLPEELPQACRFTYQRANEQVTATISMTWRVTWVGSGGTGGTLPPLTTSSDQPLTVYERQAVVTSGRG